MRKINITFVSPWLDLFPSLGLCYLSSYLKSNFSKEYLNINLVDFYNIEFHQVKLKKILTTQPDLIGFTFTTSHANQVYALARDIKAIKNIPIVIGGPHITPIPTTLPAYIDLGVLHEGEQTFLELFELLSNKGRLDSDDLKKIEGICFHLGDKVIVNNVRAFIKDIDSIPYPDRTILDMKRYLAPSHLFATRDIYIGTSIFTSRGCPYNCAFCQSNQRWGSTRYHSPEYVVDEIDYLKKTYPRINGIFIMDDLFAVNKQRLARIVELMKQKGLNKDIKFALTCRANLVDKEMLSLLKEMNTQQIQIGFESTSAKILRFLKSNSVTVQDNQRAADLIQETGMDIDAQFMFGSPGEREEDIQKTVDFMKSNRFSRVNTAVTVPLPGTKLWEIAKERGLVDEHNNDWSNFEVGYVGRHDVIYIDECIPTDRFFKIMGDIRAYVDKINYVPKIYNYKLYYLFLKLVYKLKNILNKLYL